MREEGEKERGRRREEGEKERKERGRGVKKKQSCLREEG